MGPRRQHRGCARSNWHEFKIFERVGINGAVNDAASAQRVYVSKGDGAFTR